MDSVLHRKVTRYAKSLEGISDDALENTTDDHVRRFQIEVCGWPQEDFIAQLQSRVGSSEMKRVDIAFKVNGGLIIGEDKRVSNALDARSEGKARRQLRSYIPGLDERFPIYAAFTSNGRLFRYYTGRTGILIFELDVDHPTEEAIERLALFTAAGFNKVEVLRQEERLMAHQNRTIMVADAIREDELNPPDEQVRRVMERLGVEHTDEAFAEHRQCVIDYYAGEAAAKLDTLNPAPTHSDAPRRRIRNNAKADRKSTVRVRKTHCKRNHPFEVYGKHHSDERGDDHYCGLCHDARQIKGKHGVSMEEGIAIARIKWDEGVRTKREAFEVWSARNDA